MNIKRDDRVIVFLVGGPLTTRWNQYYCLDYLNLYFRIEFWDCSVLISHPYNATDVICRPYARSINNISFVKSRLKELPPQSLIVPEIGLYKANYKFLKLISKYIKHCVIINIWDSAPFPFNDDFVNNHNVSNIKSIKSILYESTFVKLIFKFLKYGYSDEFKKQYQLIREYDESVDWIKWENKCINLFSVKVISTKKDALYRVNNVDYEKYKLLFNTPMLLKERYIVFIGQFFPYHPDFTAIMTSGASIDDVAQRYYFSLNAFFDVMESKYHCRLVIAEHPSAKHAHNPFNNRQIFYQKTAELIKNSLGVCMHFSNSISFVALYNKPLIVLGFNTLNVVNLFDESVLTFANYLKTNVINIDEPFSEDKIKLRTIEPTIRERILSEIVGDSDISNEVLYYRCFSKIFDDFES